MNKSAADSHNLFSYALFNVILQVGKNSGGEEI